MRTVLAVAVLLLLHAAPAAADLYRWIDPETGSVKFSSYPPPWYGDPAAERRAPKVEVIPARPEVVAKPDALAKLKEGAARRGEAKPAPVKSTRDKDDD
ncbi:MAG TPA: DUF4124 domain-containing protein [Burkholderiales bacterium]|jgi:hypothetical protein